MNIISWLNAHQAQLAALIIAFFAVWTAKKLVPKMNNRERGSHARWASFIVYAIGGVALAIAMVPTITYLVSLGGRSGLSALVGNTTAIAFLALGWHAVAMIVSMIRDLADGQPDHEARSAALWVPTLLPLGGAAVMQVLQNPQGLGQGITAALMGLITLIYSGVIVKRADAASNHKSKWNWFSFGVFALAGLVIIPLFTYVDSALIVQLPSIFRFVLRLCLGLAGIGLVIAMAADLWVDRTPDAYARVGARVGVALMVVFGGSAASAILDAIADGFRSLNGGS